MDKKNLDKKEQKNLEQFGFAEIDVISLDDKEAPYSTGCSGGRSDCCTRVCSETRKCKNNDSEEWESFLDVEGGQIQY